ncbi:MAG: adenine phosphoribosyltransferase [candidate division Zixibacteria bacterium]|nr:adenine phosphoribosyltransferase [candidate division Zixibacteria bacterium]
MEILKQKIRDIPDFPKPGIVFKDITTLLKDREAFRVMVDRFTENYRGHDIDLVAGIEARGFLLAPFLAYHLNAGVVPLRKPRKLPGQTRRVEYALEYGTDALEVHADAIQPGERVLVVDDLLATGGSANAACRLVEDLGGKIVGIGFLVELSFLNGRSRLTGYDIFSLIQYDSE